MQDLPRGDRRTIVVGVADATVSQPSLRWAVEQARAFGKTLLVLSIYPFARLDPWPVTPRPDTDDEASANQRLEDALERLGDERRGVEIRREAVQGRPVGVLVEASREADLLVLGGRQARGRLDQRPMSIAAQCIQLAACPVVVVPAPRRQVRRLRQQAQL